MNKDYHINSITVETISEIGKVIRVNACPFEETPFGYCYITNKWVVFNYPYSDQILQKLHQKQGSEDFDVNMDNFKYTAEHGYIHKNCFLTNNSEATYNEIDLGLSVIWADRNYGANSPSDYGIMKSYNDLLSGDVVPQGWRLPTSEDFEELIQLSRNKRFSNNDCFFYSPDGLSSLFLPPAGIAMDMNVYREGQWCEYLGDDSKKGKGKCKLFVATLGSPFVSSLSDPDNPISIRFVKDK